MGCKNRSSDSEKRAAAPKNQNEGPAGIHQLYADAESKLSTGDLVGAAATCAKARQQTVNTDPLWQSKIVLLDAEILLWQGDPSAALHMLDRLPAANRDPELLLQRNLAEGRALCLRNKLLRAKSCLDTAERLARSHDPEALGDISLARANLFHRQGRDTKAESELRRAGELADRYKNKVLRAKVLGTYVQIFTAEGYYDKALDNSAPALALSESLGARHLQAGVRLNTGWSYLELGDFEQATEFFTKAEKLAADAGMEFVRESSENNLGRIYFEQGNYRAAETSFRTALSLARELKDDGGAAIYLHNLAEVNRAIGHFDEADQYNEQAVSILPPHDRPDELRSLVTRATILIGRKEYAKAKPLLNSVLADRRTPASARWEAEDALANLDETEGKTSQARLEFDKAVRMLRRSWDEITEDEHKLAFSSWAAAFYTDYIRFLLGQGQKEKALQIAESMRARTLEEGLGTRKAQQQPLLQIPVVQRYLRGKNQAVLAYWLAPETSYLWLITPSDFQIFSLPDKRQIEQKVEQYQKTITDLDDPLQDSQKGQELYRILVEKAEKFIPPQMRVAIIPDGSLGKLNFETLIAPGATPHYWINDHELEDTSSISLLMKSRPDHNGGHRLLIIGDPVEVTKEYGPLRHAGDEINAAARHFSAASRQMVSGAGANPDSYASNKPAEYDLVHFATHGFASDAKPLDSAIVLSPNPDGNFKLYARDIIHIPVKAEVVTISTCYGAGARTYSGQGLVGLAWAFLRAGAHRVIAGLWKVDDDSTPQLMDTFYAELQNHMNPAAALRDAKRKMLGLKNSFRLPYYWASLQLYAGS